MNKGRGPELPLVLAGAWIGMIVGGLIAWFPLRIFYCASYSSPDCGEIVLMAWPFVFIIAPLTGGLIVHLLYKRGISQ